MFLYEHEGKQIFSEFGIPVPPGKVAFSVEEALNIAEEIGYPVVLKPQILGGRRGKAGAIRFAENPDDLRKNAEELFHMTLHGEKISRILVEKKVNIAHEYYLSLMVDFYEKKIIALFSTEGGIDIEEVARTNPEAIVREYIDPDVGVTQFIALDMVNRLGIKGKKALKIASVFYKLWLALKQKDLLLAEINPLAETSDGDIIALDARVMADDNAAFRQPWINSLKQSRAGVESLEYKAKEKGISFVVLEGDVGIIGNGAGLTMATVDLVKEFGGKPANFLDIGGGAGPERVFAAIETLLKLGNVKVILMNIFGGITRCDLVAQGILEALQKIDVKVPLVVRLTGTNEDLGREMLRKAGIEAYTDMIEAVKKAVELAKEGA
ncbi:MAG: ADP-forming succinate--CoA ligase subunit beta [Candidatus Njordarchaeales archaeon]